MVVVDVDGKIDEDEDGLTVEAEVEGDGSGEAVLDIQPTLAEEDTITSSTFSSSNSDLDNRNLLFISATSLLDVRR